MKIDWKNKKISIKSKVIDLKSKKTLTVIGVCFLACILVIAVLINTTRNNHLFGIGKTVEANLSNCAKISITNGYVKVDSKPISREKALEGNSYSFDVSSECKSNGYNVYLISEKNNKLDLKNVRYLITLKDSKDVIKEGNIGALNDMKDVFSSNDLKVLKKSVSQMDSAYMIFTERLNSQKENKYDLYVYVDQDYTKEDSKTSSNLSVALKTYEIGG